MTILNSKGYKILVTGTRVTNIDVAIEHFLSYVDLNFEKVLLNNMKKLDPDGEFMSCFGSTDPVTGKHKEKL